MKKYLFFLLSVSCVMLMSCGGDEPASPDNPEVNWFDSIPADKKIIPPDVTPISGLNLETFPIIDGSDSTQPIRELLAATLLGGYPCIWGYWPGDGSNRLLMYSHLDKDEQILLRSKLQMNNTHPSYNNLIDGTVDLIICARESSEDEQNYALEKGVTLIEKPIANDSFAFLLNRANSVENLTHEQVVGIYTGQITNWKEVGG